MTQPANPAPVPAPQPAPTPPAPQPTAPAPVAPPTPAVPAQLQAPAAPALAQPMYVPVMPMPTPAPSPVDPDKDVTKLPQWAQKELADIRAENAKRRISERTAIVSQHAFVAAGQLGANPAALLGSLAFGQLAEQLDPSAPDFPAKLTEAIQRTLQTNPWMAAVPATPSPGAPAAPAAPPTPPPTSGGEFPGGNPVGQPITEAQLAVMTPQQIQEAYEKGQLKHLL